MQCQCNCCLTYFTSIQEISDQTLSYLNMPEKRKNKTQKCHKCKKVYPKNMKQCKVCKCHSVSYCGEECQREDWPRHRKNCIPVMVKEYGEKGKGLVASKNIKMGELILIDKAAMSNDDIVLDSYGYTLTSDAERLLINRKILKDISILNHSCAPNAAMGLLDGKESKELENRIELRALRDISKEEEVTIFYPTEKMDLHWLHADMRERIHEDFGFDCKCPVCSGEIPNQDDIMRRMADIFSSSALGSKDEDEMTLSDWTREAIALGAIVELAKTLYMGGPDLLLLLLFFAAAEAAEKPALMEKAFDEINELAEKTGLKVFQAVCQEIS